MTSTSTPGTGSGPGSGGASTADVGRCKQACDKMKFFECSSAEEQARCYGDCDAATPSQIEVFTGCAESSICDPACRTRIQPEGSGGQGGGGASSSSCASACDKLISCSLIPLGAKSECNARCSAEGYQYQIDCVNKTACEKLEATCGGATGGGETGGGGSSSGSAGGGTEDTVASCQSECDSINFFDCAPVASHGACRSKCTSASAAARDDFVSCSKSSGVDCDKKMSCLDTFLQ